MSGPLRDANESCEANTSSPVAAGSSEEEEEEVARGRVHLLLCSASSKLLLAPVKIRKNIEFKNQKGYRRRRRRKKPHLFLVLSIVWLFLAPVKKRKTRRKWNFKKQKQGIEEKRIHRKDIKK